MTQEQGKLNGVNYAFLSKIEINRGKKLGSCSYEDPHEMVSEGYRACNDRFLS
jgi:hypothetical protein